MRFLLDLEHTKASTEASGVLSETLQTEMRRALGEGDGDESLSGSEKDESLDEDMEALKRACMLTGTNPNEIEDVSNAHATASDPEGSDSETDDVEVLRSLQQRFSAPLEDGKPFNLKPLSTLPPLSGSDDEEDFATLRAIQRRFAKYNIDALKKMESTNIHNPDTASEQETHNILLANDTTGEALDNEFRDYEDACSAYKNLGSVGDGDPRSQPLGSIEWHQPVAPVLSSLPPKDSSFPVSGEVFIDAIKKNRSCQRFVRSKLIEIEARIEENKKLLERMKVLKDFQLSCKRRAGRALSQKKDARVQLISVPKLRNSRDTKANGKKASALSYGPVENSHVQFYGAVLTTLFPLSLHRQPWSQVEKENLGKGVKQQIQEMLFDKSLVLYSGSEGSSAASDAVDSIIASITDLEFSPEILRSFLPKIDWLRLASMHFMGRSGAECEARWLNIEDPLINHSAWTKCEDKKLLHILQEKGTPYNWIDIASRLETNRTPFQCLARYQRSLNNHILKSEWTPEEDAQLCVAVEVFGEGHWQLVASNLEGRTGTQCSNRWRKTLHPSRKVVGRWTVDEDIRLKVAVMIFGPKSWPKIAKFVQGRTQVQCRERWVNALDPSLNLGEWTEDEDSKLEAAIKEHGYCWSKVAAAVPPRTDSQCRRRWKVLFPHEVPLLQAARKIQKAALISNFVDRESERPELGAGDFLALPGTDSIPDLENGNTNGKGRKQSSDTAKSRAKRSRTKAQIYPEEALSPTNCDEAETVGSDDTSSKKRKTPKLPLKMKKAAKSVQISIPDSENGNNYGNGKETSSDSPKSRPKRSRTKAQIYTEAASSSTSCDDDETIGSYMSSKKRKIPELHLKRKNSAKSVQISIPDLENGNSKGKEKERSSDSPKSRPRRSRTEAQIYTEEASSPTSCDDDETIGSYMSSTKRKTPKLSSKKKKSAKSVQISIPELENGKFNGEEKERLSDAPESRPKAQIYAEEALSPTNCGDAETICSDDTSKKRKALKLPSKRKKSDKSVQDHQDHSSTPGDSSRLEAMNCEIEAIGGNDATKEQKTLKSFSRSNVCAEPAPDHHSVSLSAEDLTTLRIRNADDAGTSGVDYANSKEKSAIEACPNKRKYTKPIQDGHNLSGSNAGNTGMEDYHPKITNPTTGDAGRMHLTYFRKKKKQVQLDRGL